MRNIILVSICILYFFTGTHAQSCDCYIQNADTTFALAPMGLGTDTGGAPYYRCDNCSSLPIKIPFHFCFYGNEYDTVYINNKGSLSFIHPVFNFSSTGLPAGNDTLMLAAFWSDIDNRMVDPFSAIYYSLSPTHLIVQWSTVGYNTFDDDLYNNFQLTITNGSDPILPTGNNVAYCYWLMQWASADSSGGIGGFDGIPATVGINKGDNIHYAQIGEFNFPGSAYSGPFNPNSGVYWLINKSFIFNTCVSRDTIPPVIIHTNSCDSIVICAGDTTTFTTSFICAQKGQTATLSLSPDSLSGLTTNVTSANALYTISIRLIASLKDTGSYIIYAVATDNSYPALKDSIPYTIIIKNCDTIRDTGTGINQLSINNRQSRVYPNPNNGIFTIQATGEKQNAESNIDIYNILGEKVYSQSSITHFPLSINLSSQPVGVYFYLLKDEQGNLVGNGKFAIQ